MGSVHHGLACIAGTVKWSVPLISWAKPHVGEGGKYLTILKYLERESVLQDGHNIHSPGASKPILAVHNVGCCGVGEISKAI